MASGTTTGADIELISLWVAPFARGMGVGDALVDAVLGWSTTLQPARIRLSVKESNQHAIALYERHGFADAGPNEDEAESEETRERWMILR